MGTDVLVFASVTVLLAPISVGAAWFQWAVWREAVAADPTGRRLRLSLVLAISSTIGAASSTYLAAAAILAVWSDVARAVVQDLRPLTFAAFIALQFISILNAGYLRWLRSRGHVG